MKKLSLYTSIALISISLLSALPLDAMNFDWLVNTPTKRTILGAGLLLIGAGGAYMIYSNYKKKQIEEIETKYANMFFAIVFDKNMALDEKKNLIRRLPIQSIADFETKGITKKIIDHDFINELINEKTSIDKLDSTTDPLVLLLLLEFNLGEDLDCKLDLKSENSSGTKVFDIILSNLAQENISENNDKLAEKKYCLVSHLLKSFITNDQKDYFDALVNNKSQIVISSKFNDNLISITDYLIDATSNNYYLKRIIKSGLLQGFMISRLSTLLSKKLITETIKDPQDFVEKFTLINPVRTCRLRLLDEYINRYSSIGETINSAIGETMLPFYDAITFTQDRETEIKFADIKKKNYDHILVTFTTPDILFLLLNQLGDNPITIEKKHSEKSNLPLFCLKLYTKEASLDRYFNMINELFTRLKQNKPDIYGALEYNISLRSTGKNMFDLYKSNKKNFKDIIFE